MLFSEPDPACRIPSEMWSSEPTMTLQEWLTPWFPGEIGWNQRVSESSRLTAPLTLASLYHLSIYPHLIFYENPSDV